MSDEDKETLVLELAERLKNHVEHVPGRKRGLLVYRSAVFLIMSGGAAMATKVYTMVESLVNVPAKVETISRSVDEIQSAAAGYDGRYLIRAEAERSQAAVDKRLAESQEWSIKHGADIQDLKEFKSTATEKLSNIEKTTARIELKLDAKG